MSDYPIPDNWAERKFDEVVSVDLDNLSENTPQTYRFKYISLSDVDQGKITSNIQEVTFCQAPSRARRVLHDKDILFATVRPNLQGFALLGSGVKDMIASTGFAVLTEKEFNSTEYIYHYLYSDHATRQINNLVAGSNYPAISSLDVKKLKIWIPVGKREQRKIARILSTVDEVIGRTEAAIGKYQAIKQGMMHDLFTRGLDHNGKLRPRREEAPELYHQTALGWLPKEWEVLALHEVVQVRTGIALNSKRKFIDPITAHYLRVANVQDGYLDLSEMKTIQVERSDLERYRVHPGDVLMNEGGDLDKLGRGCLWGGQYAPCVHQNHVFVVRCNAAVLPAFLNKWTETSTARRYFMVAGKQTTNLASINKTQLGGLPIVTPPVSEQTRMVRFMNTFEKREKTEVRQLEKGKLIKQALMQDLLTGRKAVVL